MKRYFPKQLPSLLLLISCFPLTAQGGSMEERLLLLEKSLSDQQRATQIQQEKLNAQQRILDEQNRLIRQQADMLTRQRDELQQLRSQIITPDKLQDLRATGNNTSPESNAGGTVPPLRVSQSETTGQKPVGKSPPQTESQRPTVQSIANIGGVLTPKGKMVLEPSLQFSHSQVNRLTFLGVEILETFLIGILEAQDANRDLVSPALTLRYGLTPRLEIEGKLPYIWRKDKLNVTLTDVQGEPQVASDQDGSGIGDVELAVHYQMNAGLNGWPVFIANLRYKSTTGEGPFDVSMDSMGRQTELATGSGFHGIEPSITLLKQSDPAVFFANVGYLVNLKDDVNKTFLVEGSDPQNVGEVDPGDAFRLSFGMAYSINQKASFSLGYKHDFIQKTDTEINNITLSSSSLDIGSMLMGFSYQVNPNMNASINLELGVTADAPDVTVTMRLPYSL